MSTPQEQFQQFLDQQRADYKRVLPEKLAHLQMLWTVVEAGAAPSSALVELERLAHTLAGTAGTLGFRDVGLAAKSLELLLTEASEGDEKLTHGQLSQISLAMASLQASLPRD
jgi:chemotaxis protein histidine kinase CheA